MVAGLIERASRLLPQLSAKRVVTLDCLRAGLILILIGLFKTVVIADTAGVRVDEVFLNPTSYFGLMLWRGAFLFTLQIYCDFSGYSNIARGVSRLLGIRLVENFKTPFFSKNISEFWRRWHVSLSEWLRDYLSIPLGGNRKGVAMTYRNLFLTMLIGGLWHGAACTYVIWGGLHGVYLIVFQFWSRLNSTLLPGPILPRWISGGFIHIAYVYSGHNCVRFFSCRHNQWRIELRYRYAHVRRPVRFEFVCGHRSVGDGSVARGADPVLLRG